MTGNILYSYQTQIQNKPFYINIMTHKKYEWQNLFAHKLLETLLGVGDDVTRLWWRNPIGAVASSGRHWTCTKCQNIKVNASVLILILVTDNFGYSWSKFSLLILFDCCIWNLVIPRLYLNESDLFKHGNKIFYVESILQI